MRASDHTRAMLRWLQAVGVDRVDLAVRRRNAAMIWHHDLAIARLPLAWARAENLRHGEVYARPARGYSWPVVFLDDVEIRLAERIARKYSAAVIHTSPLGGCHVWLQCAEALDEEGRRDAQRWLATRCAADLGSTSGEHLGRLAGFKNSKRGGCWVNVLAASKVGPWRPPRSFDAPPEVAPTTAAHSTSGRDNSPSARDWAWVCRRLELGESTESVLALLVEAARERRGRDAERYARRTVRRASERISGRR